jgi:hypothetical protein
MNENPLYGAIDGNELEDFKVRNPSFEASLARLQTQLSETLERQVSSLADKPEDQQFVLFFLAHQAVEEFFDIVLLAVHGRGLGALRLLRALYERIVTTLYLMKHPEDVKDFNDYADVHARRVINHATSDGGDISRWVSTEKIAEIEEFYQRVKARFQETVCNKCEKRRDQPSWTKKDFKALAREAGLVEIYGAGWFWPTMLLHTTRVGLEARLDVSPDGFKFQHGPRRQDADRALGYAHVLIVSLVYKCNEFFRWNIDLDTIVQDAQACWAHIGEVA